MRIIYAILFLIAVIAALASLFFVYDWLRRKMNKTRIGGIEYFLCKLLERDDYVSINGKVMRFSHIARNGETLDIFSMPSYENRTLGGELAFSNPRGLGYIFYPETSLRHCEFIYGEYGLKWALSNKWAETAKDKIEDYWK